MLALCYYLGKQWIDKGGMSDDNSGIGLFSVPDEGLFSVEKNGKTI